MLAHDGDEMNIIGVKKIAVKDLPDGYFKSQLASFVKDSALADVYVVATEGGAKDWSAYCGWPEFEQIQPGFIQKTNAMYYCHNVREAADVASVGDKFPEAEAVLLFPEFKDKIYRP